MAVVALLCAFIVGWRQFALFVAGLALIVAVYVSTKVKHSGPSRTRSMLAIIFALAACVIAGYNLSQLTDSAAEPVPSELNDTAVSAPNDATLDRLRMSMDSSQASEQE
jgi:hypothetical protein